MALLQIFGRCGLRRPRLLLPFGILVLLGFSHLKGTGSVPSANKIGPPPEIVEVSTRLPLVFEKNEGQTDRKLHFLSRGPGYSLLFTLRDIQLILVDRPSEPASGLLRIEFAGARPNPRLRGVEELTGKVHYLKGNVPDRWRKNISTFNKVKYENLYPGIDVLFYGNPKKLEYDFTVAPGADPRRIRLTFKGMEQLGIDPSGNLVVALNGQSIRMQKPFAYQNRAGQKTEVPCSFLLRNNHEVGFTVGEYETDKPLIIDPVLEYSSYWGGSQRDTATSIGTDDAGNLYVTGFTTSVDLPVSFSSFQGKKAPASDVFIVKVSANGALAYSTYLGGQADDSALGIALDASRRAYVTGWTRSSDFPVVRGFQQKLKGGTDVFLAVLSENGSSLAFSTFLGGSRDDVSRGVAVDSAGRIYLCGSSNSTDFPVAQAVQPQLSGVADAFISKLNPDLGQLVFSTYLGGQREDSANALALDSAGHVYLVGHTASNEFPTQNAFQPNNQGGTDAFVSKLNAEGKVIFSTYLGGRRSDVGLALALDSEDNIYIAGETNSIDFPLVAALQSLLAGGADMFVSKFDTNGTKPLYSTYLGGRDNDSALALDVDAAGSAYVTGASASDNFPLSGALFAKEAGVDAVLVKLDRTGTLLQFSTFMGGGNHDIGTAVSVGRTGEVYVAGTLLSTDFPMKNALQSSFRGTGVYHTSDGAQNWLPSGYGLGDPNILDLAMSRNGVPVMYVGTSAHGVFRSMNGGVDWSAAGLESTAILALAVDPTDPQQVYAGTPRSMFKSADGGQTWTSINKGLPTSTAFRVVAVDMEKPSTLYVGTPDKGIFKSTDGGQNWRAINNGLDGPAQQIFSIVIDPKDPLKLYIGTQAALFKSADGGSNWQTTTFTGVGPVLALAVDPRSDSTIYATGFSNGSPVFAKSTDGGVTWRALLIQGIISSLLVDPLQTSTIYASTFNAGVLKSTDGGTTWQSVNTGLESLDVRDIAFLGTEFSRRVFAGTISGPDSFLMKMTPANIFYFPQIGDGEGGRTKLQTALIFVNAGENTSVKVEFFDPSGNPLTLSLEGLGTASSFTIPLKKGEALSTRTTGQGPIRAGYARVTTTEGVGGTAVFSRMDTPTGQILYEAGVPASVALSRFAVFLDSLQNKDTGIAIVNTSPPDSGRTGEAELTVRLYDKNSNLIQEKIITLSPGQHLARFISEIFSDIADQVGEMQGVLTVDSNRPVVAITVRQNDDPSLELPLDVASLTAFPVIPLNTLQNTVYFPQVGDGVFGNSRFQTSIILANTGLTTGTITLEFFDTQGQPLPLKLGAFGVSQRFEIRLGPKQFFFAETSASNDLKAGFARIRSSSLDIGATAVFAETDARVKIRLYETGVPPSTPQRAFSVFIDSLGRRDTGLAVVNVSQQNAQITLRVYDKNFHLLGEQKLTLAPGNHLARYVFELFPGLEAQVSEMEGVLSVESTEPLVAVTLRQTNDPSIDFPAEVPVLTTFPVIPGIAR